MALDIRMDQLQLIYGMIQILNILESEMGYQFVPVRRRGNRKPVG